MLKVGRTAYVGRGGRTDEAGIAQLAACSEPRGWTVVAVPVTKVLHLKSGVTALPDGTVVGFPPLVDDTGAYPSFLAVPEEHGTAVVDLGDSADGRRAVLMSADAPRTAELYAARGLEVVTVPITEFEKLEGCVTCLSVRIRPDRQTAARSTSRNHQHRHRRRPDQLGRPRPEEHPGQRAERRRPEGEQLVALPVDARHRLPPARAGGDHARCRAVDDPVGDAAGCWASAAWSRHESSTESSAVSPTSGGYIVAWRTPKLATRSGVPSCLASSAAWATVRTDASLSENAHVSRVNPAAATDR